MTKSENNSKSIEELLKELSTIVTELEREELSLEDSLAYFEKGVALTKECHSILEATEERLEELSNRP